MSELLACEVHDYVEIACMYRYQVRLHWSNGSSATGVARDILARQGREWLVLECDGERCHYELVKLSEIEVLTPGAKFSRVQFNHHSQ